MGGDDYLAKPFSLDELIARVRAMVRRNDLSTRQETSAVLQYLDLVLDEDRLEVSRGARPISLTPTEFRLLRFLLIAALVVAVVSLRPRESGRDLVTGAAAILVALLPIRAVLVPSDLPGITLVDLALGWEVGLLTALTAWTASNLIGGTRRSAVVELEAERVRSETSNEENACEPGSTTDADSTARPGEPPPTA